MTSGSWPKSVFFEAFFFDFCRGLHSVCLVGIIYLYIYLYIFTYIHISSFSCHAWYCHGLDTLLSLVPLYMIHTYICIYYEYVSGMEGVSEI